MSLWIDFYRAIEVCFVQTRQIFQITFDNDWFSFTKDLGVFLGLVYLVFLFFWLLLSVFFFFFKFDVWKRNAIIILRGVNGQQLVEMVLNAVND